MNSISEIDKMAVITEGDRHCHICGRRPTGKRLKVSIDGYGSTRHICSSCAKKELTTWIQILMGRYWELEERKPRQKQDIEEPIAVDV